MGGGGGKINKPKAARSSIRKVTREKRRLGKKPHVRSEETLADTTLNKLRQCRTNPKANVRLSGKKKRMLAREAKRMLAEKTEMEVVGLVQAADGEGSSVSCERPQPASQTTTTTMDTS